MFSFDKQLQMVAKTSATCRFFLKVTDLTSVVRYRITVVKP